MRKLISIASWIVGIFVGFVLVLVASIVIDRAMAVGKVDKMTNTIIPNGTNPAVRAYVSKPDGEGPFPVVIMVHEWWGLKEEIIGKADELAKDGYVVIAPDVMRGNTTSWIPTAIYQVSSTPTTQIDSDIDSVLQWAANQSFVDRNRIAIMGFCFGGGTALRYGIQTPAIKATAIFYGSAITDPAILKSLNGPVLGVFGADDTMIPLSEVAALEAGLTAAGIPNEITIYEGEGHAFITSVEEIKKGGNQGKAWQQLRTFLASSFSAQGYTRVRPVALTQQNAIQQDWNVDRLVHLYVCNQATARSAFRDQ
jgi:carboxymethylenebutenolidase